MGKLTEAAFAAYLKNMKGKLAASLPVTREKPINYGHQLVIEKSSRKLNINVYNGKKGLSIVYSGDSTLKEQAVAILAGNVQAASSMQQAEVERKYTLWAGSDESGKGDFFGSLVIAAVVVDDTTAGKLQAAGVKDCKLLTDKKILALEDVIKNTVVEFSVLELKPKFYNLRYEQVAAKGGKLNQLLGLGHIAALTQVLNKQPKCQGALIDQFTTSNAIVRELQGRFPGCHISQQPKAESDLAVAAASVLARAQFLHTMDTLALLAGEDALPKGGSALATEAARRIASRIGKAELRNFVKLHFANYQRI